MTIVWAQASPGRGGRWGWYGNTRDIRAASLDAQLARACRAMDGWDGSVDLPSNPLLALERDRRNRELLAEHADLALEVAARVLDHHLPGVLLRDIVARIRHIGAKVLLGLDRDRWAPTTTEAMVLRELTSQFVRAGVGQ